MTITLNQALFLILTIAGVAAVVVLIRLFSQLRKTAEEGEKALAEFADLARHLKELDLVVKDQVEALAETIAASKKAAVNVADASSLITRRVFRPSSRYLALLIPVARFLWRQAGKKKKRREPMSSEGKSCVVETAVSFLIGAAAGFVAGILLAPASGKETREKIGEELHKGTEKAKEGVERLAQEAEKGFRTVRDKTHEGIEAVKDFVEKKKGVPAKE